jgi:hypothetical protein
MVETLLLALLHLLAAVVAVVLKLQLMAEVVGLVAVVRPMRHQQQVDLAAMEILRQLIHRREVMEDRVLLELLIMGLAVAAGLHQLG